MSDDRFASFCHVMDTLLGEGGCPWDRAQTYESLKPYLLEECYEAVDAIDQHDRMALCEELGDVLMEVVFLTKLAERDGAFTVDDVLTGITDKLVSRHSHIFGGDVANTAEEVEAFWAANKNKEKNYQSTADKLRAVPKALPALIRAEKVISRSGEKMPSEGCFNEVRALLDGFEKTAQTDSATASDYYGKLLFLLVKIAANNEINAEFSLTNQIEAFINTTAYNAARA